MDSWPLVGRDSEVDRVFASLTAPDGRGVVIAGPVGVGKTRLAEHAVRALDPGVPVRHIRATRSAEAIPLGAFATLLPADISDLTDDTARLRRAAEAILETETSAEPVVFVDDIHALDAASATLLLALVTSNRARIIATLRTNEPVPDAVTATWRDGQLDRIDLSPFAADQTTTLLTAALDGPVDGLTVRTLQRMSDGNLLYLRELIGELLESGLLAEVTGLWTLLGPVAAPSRLTELIADRLAGLDDTDRLLLEVVALGEPIGLVRIEERGWGPSLERLERRQLVAVVPDGRRRQVRMVNPLYVDVVGRDLTGGRRQRILLGLIEAIESHGLKRREDPRRLAHLRLEAGIGADAQVLLAAARDATAAEDYEHAAVYARAAVGSGADVEASHLLGRCLDQLGRHEDAELMYVRAEDEASSEGKRTVVALGRSENLFRGLARADDAYAVLTDARANITDPALRDELVSQQAMFKVLEGFVAEALRLVGALLDRTEDDRAFCQGALQASMAMLLGGRVVEAISLSQRAFDARCRLGDQEQMSHPGVFLVAHALALGEDGQIEAAVDTARTGYDASVSMGNRDGQAWFSTALARAHLLAGRLEQAAHAGREAAAAFADNGHPGSRWGLGAVALARGQQGDVDRGSDAIERLDGAPPTTILIMDADVERGRAWVRAASGDLVRARAAAMGAADFAADRGQHALELAALHDVARLGDAPTVVERTRLCADRVDGGLADVRRAHVEGLALSDAKTLEDAADGFETVGAILWAAEASSEAAIAHRAAGDVRHANASAQRSRSLAARCEGAATPSLGVGIEAALLTRREREIAGLAAGGLSNREIADALFVSHRTVANQLQRVYEKLGINRRSDLQEALSRSGM